MHYQILELIDKPALGQIPIKKNPEHNPVKEYTPFCV